MTTDRTALVRTSETHPIEVDWLPQSTLGLSGRIGLTFAPGKCGPGVTANWNRDLDVDLMRLRGHHGVDLLVSLMEDFEYDLLAISDLPERAAGYGIQVIRYPIRDVSVPRSMESFAQLIRQVIVPASAGRTIAVHCRGGMGRAGLTAACCLVALGHEPAAAIRITRQARPGTVETREQERFVWEFAKAHGAAGDQRGV